MEPNMLGLNRRADGAVVKTDIVESHQSGMHHLQRQLRTAKWQSEKDAIVDSMNYHLTRHRPKIRMTEQQCQKRDEIASNYN